MGLFDWLSAILTAIWDFIKDHLLEIILLVLVVVLIIYGFPYLAGLLPEGSILATMLSSAAAWTATAVTTAWSWIATGAGSLWSTFKGLELYQQALVVGGIGLLIAPDETADFVNEIVDSGVEVVGNAVSGLAGAVGTPLLLLGAGAVLLYLLASSGGGGAATAGTVTAAAASEDDEEDAEDLRREQFLLDN
jgi:hypothetical protein